MKTLANRSNVSKAISRGAACWILVFSVSATQATLIAFDSFATTAGGQGYAVGPIQNQNPTAGLGGFTGAWNGGTTAIAAANGGLTHDLTPGTPLEGQIIAATFSGNASRRLSRAIDYIPIDGTYYMSVMLRKNVATTFRDIFAGLGPLEPPDSEFGSSQATYIGINDGGISFTPGMAVMTELLTAEQMTVGETYFAMLQFDFSTSGDDAVTATIFDGSSSQVARQTFTGLSLDGDIGRFGLATRSFSPDVVADEWRFGTELSNVMALGPACDFSGDGLCNVTDIDLMQSLGPIDSGITAAGNEQFDLNGDGTIDLADRDEWLNAAASENGFGSPYKLGDANVDGVVDGQDFIAWNGSKFTNRLLWSLGNFSGDAVIDGQDFILWNGTKFTSSDFAAIPEPGSALFGWISLMLLGVARGKQ